MKMLVNVTGALLLAVGLSLGCVNWTTPAYLVLSVDPIFGFSLLNQEPRLWRGAILNSPTAFPDLARTGVARILINCGAEDEYHTFGTIRKFQAEAARAGIPVTIAAHNAGHVFISAEANRESTQQFVEFLFE